MLKRLQDSEEFKNDYKKYQKAISEIKNTQLQNDCVELLKELRSAVHWVDSIHDQMYITHRLPTDVSEARNKIAHARKQLDQKINAYQRKAKKTV